MPNTFRAEVCARHGCVYTGQAFLSSVGVLLPGKLCTRHGVRQKVLKAATDFCLPPTPVWNYLHHWLDKYFLQRPTRHKPDTQPFYECVGTSMQILPPASIAAHLRVRSVDFWPTALLSRRAMNLKSICRPFSQAGGKHGSLSPSLCFRSFSNREQSLQCPIHSVKQKRSARSTALCRYGHTRTKKKEKKKDNPFIYSVTANKAGGSRELCLLDA